jgi:hypothetical protein
MNNVIIPESQVENAVNLRSLRDQLLDLDIKARELQKKIEMQVWFAFQAIPKCSYVFRERPSRTTQDPAIDNDPSDDAQVIVYNYNNFFLLRDGSGWGTQDPKDNYATLIPTPQSQWPITPEAFKEKVFKVTSHLELKVVFYTMDVRRLGGTENITALKLLYKDKNVELVDEGSVSYVGWDISDKWYKATIDGVLWAFWQDDGHGGKIKHSAQEGTLNWDKFLAFLETYGT